MRGWTVVFDLDGTLVDTAPDLAAATNHVLAQRGLPALNEKEIRPYVGHGALRMIEEAMGAHGVKLEQRELFDLFEVFIVYYAANIAKTSKPYDGVISTLESLHEQGATLAVCTNKLVSHARGLLDALNMTHFFLAITGRDSLGAYKPDPRHLTGTIALAKGDARRAIMIGDSETDILTAKNASIPVIAVDFGYSETPVARFSPDRIVSHYRDMTEAVTGLTKLVAPART